jgi:hypothetical protein
VNQLPTSVVVVVVVVLMVHSHLSPSLQSFWSLPPLSTSTFCHISSQGPPHTYPSQQALCFVGLDIVCSYRCPSESSRVQNHSHFHFLPSVLSGQQSLPWHTCWLSKHFCSPYFCLAHVLILSIPSLSFKRGVTITPF